MNPSLVLTRTPADKVSPLQAFLSLQEESQRMASLEPKNESEGWKRGPFDTGGLLFEGE